jgi:hypothetical protein
MKRAYWLLILLGCLWLGVNGWNVAHYWSGGPLSSDEYLLSYERPNSWGDQHPECRDRFGFWPDGERMDASELRGLILPRLDGGGLFVADLRKGTKKPNSRGGSS